MAARASQEKPEQRDLKICDNITSCLHGKVFREVENLCHNLHIGKVVLFRRNGETTAVI